MADTGRPDDGTENGPSLEMPSFSLRRKKKAKTENAAAADVGPAQEPDPIPEPAQEPDPIPEPEPEPEPIREPGVATPARAAYEPPTAVVPAVPATEDDAGTYDEPGDDTEPRRTAPRRELPLSGLPAAVVTGVVVGALAVLCAWLAGRGCDAVRGTSSCGGGPGFLILLVVLALLAWTGGFLLARFNVPDAGSTSLLGVGIMAVLVLVFLLGSLDEWWSVIAVPIAAVIGYGASWWVTNAVVGDDDREAAEISHDVR